MKKKSKIIFIMVILIIIAFICLLNYEYLKKVFISTLIIENRYKLILDGLKETLIISIISILIGSILGVVICYFRMHNNYLIRNIGKFVISLLQGLPITIILLIFYYVIFGNININAIIVSILAFSIYFSAYVAEIYRSALETISKNQIDSAYALGFNKIQTIRYIVLPQMLTYVIPIFKNESVSIIKLTSVVGFISVMDLTRASEIIRNRTYDAFFPLILTAIIYYFICFIFCKILDLLYKKICPRGVIKNEK